MPIRYSCENRRPKIRKCSVVDQLPNSVSLMREHLYPRVLGNLLPSDTVALSLPISLMQRAAALSSAFCPFPIISPPQFSPFFMAFYLFLLELTNGRSHPDELIFHPLHLFSSILFFSLGLSTLMVISSVLYNIATRAWKPFATAPPFLPAWWLLCWKLL